MIDILIVGGGLCGCVLASRLKEYNPSLSICLLEAGPDEHEHPLITDPMGTMQLHNSAFQYNYKTVPQEGLDGREIFHAGGKVLSGSSSVNYAAWTRGDRADYDLWGETVGDNRWKYDSQLPYFRKSESHHDQDADPVQHGFTGPIATTPASARTYPLTKPLSKAWTKVGVKINNDHNCGDNKGMGPHAENWYRGKRQPAGKAYGLKGVDVLINKTVRRIILEKAGDNCKAIGVELVSGKILSAGREIILCCGAIRTPQILLLSGIGPASELLDHKIPQMLESPDVGRNFSDHGAITLFYRVRDPSKGLCAPHPNFDNPAYIEGFPTDVMIAESAPVPALKAALMMDEGKEAISDDHLHIFPPRSHYEILPMYAPTEVPLSNMDVPYDGSIMSVGILNLLPTSRGTITLASTDPDADPLIDPNYFTTETDRVVLRAAIRRVVCAFETPEAQEVIEAEVLPPPSPVSSGAKATVWPILTSQSTDAEIDARVRRQAGSFYHGCGSASMGKVVDTACRVKGVEDLRIVDASVIPVPLSAHYQVALYAFAEQMAEIISKRA